MNLAVDIGNTQIKVGLFAKNVLQEQWRLSGVSEVLALVDDKNVSAAIVSSVKEADDLTARVPSGVFTLVLNGHTALPFVNHYLTPHTLGTDRVAAVAGAQHHLPRQNTLVIDAGTCITYDLIDRKAQYQGGLISPGLTMRFARYAYFHRTFAVGIVDRTSHAQPHRPNHRSRTTRWCRAGGQCRNCPNDSDVCRQLPRFARYYLRRRRRIPAYTTTPIPCGSIRPHRSSARTYPHRAQQHTTASCQSKIASLLLRFYARGQRIMVKPVATAYSAQGIGNPSQLRLTHNRSMGGIGYGTGNGLNINYVNPSLLYKNTLSSFDVALDFEQVTQTRGDEEAILNQGGISYGVFALPIIAGRWSASVGVMPYSTVGYRISEEVDIVGNENTALRVLEGEGGLNVATFSNGVRVYKNLAVGARISYLFGAVTQTRTLSLVNTGGLVSSYEDQLYYSDLLIEPSISFGQNIGNKTTLNVGLVYQPTTDIRTTRDVSFANQVRGSDVPVGDQQDLGRDTSNVRLPQKLGIGLSVDKYLKYTIGVDFSTQAWEDFRSFNGSNDAMRNSYEIAVGGQYIPDATSVDSYLSRMAYRLGFSYRNTPFTSEDEQISEFGINFGLSLPVSNLSSINLASEIGRRGTTDQNLIRENYWKITLGVTFNDRWFVRRKFD